MHPTSKIPLGQLLIENRIITSDQLAVALKKQQETGELLGSALLTLGFVAEESVLYPVLAEQIGVEFVNLKTREIPGDIIARLPAKFAVHYKVIPVDFKEEVLTVATAHPRDIHVIDGVRLSVTSQVQTVLAGEKDILEAIRKYYGVGAETIAQMMGSGEIEQTAASLTEDIREIDSEASIAKFLNQILLQAYKDRATDIHIEPFENDLKVRYRIDGVLCDAQVPAPIWRFKDSINSRIKIMANLNIAEKRLPQDGRFRVNVENVPLDLRISFLPTAHGESAVLRLLSVGKLYDMKDLGLSEADLRRLDTVIKKPHGIVFVTGPTGSGKTTTLYACLSHINTPDKKIITIEDPVEYQLGGMTQIQINPAVGLTFARGLRSMLRHDPDIMMVGEVRDLETAEIAIQIALTGHLVFSTLHTNDAASGVTRLMDMGLEPYLISSAVECFLAQRLVRRICPKCKEKTKISETVLRDFGLEKQNIGEGVIYRGRGCAYCHGTGYFGREGIYEFLFMQESLREMILNRATASQLKAKAVTAGMQTLLQHGWEKIKRGITTPDEVMRVTTEETAS